jgi:flavin reductase (DIM6/NTAB) family NADH-FMN oxidoreductase RutF
MADEQSLLESGDSVLWIVTARSGQRTGGLVATFVNTAAITPQCPRVIVGLARSHHTWELVEASEAFALHQIAEKQIDWVWRFGLRSGRNYDKFGDLNWRSGATGSPILDDAIGWLDCRVEARMETGDRTIYLAEIVDAQVRGPGRPLTVKRMLELASPQQVQELKQQRSQDAAADAEIIRQWREMQAGSHSHRKTV